MAGLYPGIGARPSYMGGGRGRLPGARRGDARVCGGYFAIASQLFMPSADMVSIMYILPSVPIMISTQ